MSTIMERQQVVERPVVPEEEGRRREMLLHAAEIIERDGYIAGHRGMLAKGPWCMLGAVAHAMKGPTGVAGHYLYDAPAKLIGRPKEEVYAWSDQWRFKGDSKAVQRIATALRRRANGASWCEATRE
jgi:hypothetical protein